MFELELSWVGEFTDGVHKRVPEDVSLNVKYYYYVIFLSLLFLTLESLLRCYRTQKSSPSLPLKRTAILTRTCLNSLKTFQLDMMNIDGANP